MQKTQIALYARVSRNEQHPELQRNALLKKAELEGWDYEYFEEKESTRKTRPIKNSLYQRLLKGEFDGVCVWRLDRWGRTLSELVNEMDVLVRRNISFISLHEGIDFSTATGKLQFHIFSAFAEFERNLMSERIKAGKDVSKKKQGRPKGSKDERPRRKSGYYQRWSRVKYY